MIAMPIIIKRYRNRKLYNTESKSYITLKGIEDLIKQKAEVRIIDNPSGRDITAATLSQIIYELEKNYSGFLPINLLFSLVQSGGNRIDEIRRNIFNSLNLSHHYDVEIERRMNLLVENGEYSQEVGNQILERLLAAGYIRDDGFVNVESLLIDFFNQQNIPTKSDFKSIIHKLDKLSQRVDDFYTDNTNALSDKG